MNQIEENLKPIPTCLNCGGPCGKDFAFCCPKCKKAYQARDLLRRRYLKGQITLEQARAGLDIIKKGKD